MVTLLHLRLQGSKHGVNKHDKQVHWIIQATFSPAQPLLSTAKREGQLKISQCKWIVTCICLWAYVWLHIRKTCIIILSRHQTWIPHTWHVTWAVTVWQSLTELDSDRYRVRYFTRECNYQNSISGTKEAINRQPQQQPFWFVHRTPVSKGSFCTLHRPNNKL